MKTTFLAIACAVLWVGSAAAAPWGLADCQPPDSQKWLALKEEIRHAKPGSPLYLPHPFPKTDAEVIADYLYQYQEMWNDTPPSQVFEEEKDVLAGVKQGTLRFEIVRVENWTPMRCTRHNKKTEFDFMLRIFESATGIELARTALDDAGYIAMSANATAQERSQPVSQQRQSLKSLAEGLRLLEQEFGVRGDAPQYVYTWGVGGLRCQTVAPCIAFRDGDKTYLLNYRGEWFTIPAQRRRLFQDQELATSESRDRLLQSLAPEERLISLGGQEYAIAHEVKRTSKQ